MTLASPVAKAACPRFLAAGKARAFAGRLQDRWIGLPDFPARCGLRIANMPWLRQLLGRRYERALVMHMPHLPNLSVEDRNIVDALKHSGVYITSLEKMELPHSEKLLASANRLVCRFAAEARRRVKAGETFVIVPPDWIVGQPMIYKWGLNDRLLNIAEAYLGLPAAYDGVAINYTVADGREVSTRKWHRDWEDRRMLKVAVYLHDVAADGGPFEMISHDLREQNDAHGYHYDLVSDLDVGEELGANFRSAIVSCEGRSGTVIFTDTARFFHRGKPSVARDRAAIFYSYFTQRPRHPFFCERTGLKRLQIKKLLAPLNARQRQAGLWQRQLPFWLRLIPPARL